MATLSDDRLKCDGDPKCTNAPTHAHPRQGTYYCDKCCPLSTCPEAHANRL
jgi:hypothetical protein